MWSPDACGHVTRAFPEPSEAQISWFPTVPDVPPPVPVRRDRPPFPRPPHLRSAFQSDPAGFYATSRPLLRRQRSKSGPKVFLSASETMVPVLGRGDHEGTAWSFSPETLKIRFLKGKWPPAWSDVRGRGPRRSSATAMSGFHPGKNDPNLMNFVISRTTRWTFPSLTHPEYHGAHFLTYFEFVWGLFSFFVLTIGRKGGVSSGPDHCSC